MTESYRVIAVQEEGSEICLASGMSEDEAYDSLPEFREMHEEYRSFSVEMECHQYSRGFEDEWWSEWE
tara:strand:+ start:69 stop:272 length:204 start_codon:yes stop_codon:yes gene_type:complete